MKFTSIREFVERHERILSVLATALGFLIDNLFLGRADLLPGQLLLYFYFVSSGALILLIHAAEEGVWRNRWSGMLRPWLPLALQFIFGSLFSAFLVFYSHSASPSVSWPFLLVLFALFASTEIFKRYQDRLVLQCGLYFFGLFSFCIYTVPLVVGTIGTQVFLISGGVSIALFALFLWILFFTGKNRLKENLRRILITAAVVLVVMNALYFSHVLPPLPLALKDIGVYHALVRTDAGYETSGEPDSLLADVLNRTSVHIQKGEAVYVFSSVFTPLSIQTDLVHHWERLDEGSEKWITTSIVAFPALGGRDAGYRGFSEISHISSGRWRVSVETPNKALIGRIEFTVVYVAAEPVLQNTLK